MKVFPFQQGMMSRLNTMAVVGKHLVAGNSDGEILLIDLTESAPPAKLAKTSQGTACLVDAIMWSPT